MSSREDLDRPYGVWVPVTPGSPIEPPSGYSLPTRGLLVGTGGAATMTDCSNTSRASVPLVAGYHRLQVMAIASATASNIWALF